MENGIAVLATGQQSVVKHTTKTAILVEKVYTAQYQKSGTLSAQLRQEIHSSADYPGARATNDLTENPYGNSEFGFATKNYTNTEKRVAWINVPVGQTVEMVQAKISEMPKPVLCKFLSNRPILTSDQQYAINAGLGNATMDSYAETQVVRYPTDSAQAGKIVLDPNGKVQYRAVFLRNDLEDQDLRTADPKDMYVSPAIAAELSGAPISATVIPEQGL